VNPTAGDRMDSVRRSASCAALLAALVLALSAAPAQPLVPTPVRLRDAVGDTIDAAERDSFRLFPNTAGFRQAVILALPGPEFFAEVTITTADTSRFIYYRILPNQLERIRFLIDNPSFMAEQLERDPNAELAFNYFWKAIEQNPLKSIGGPPANLPEPDASGTPLENKENRYHLTLLGTGCGSVVGGCAGSYAGYTLIEPGHWEQSSCGSVWIPPLYRANIPVVLATSIGASALAGWAGYSIGESQDRRPAPAALPGEGKSWRSACLGIGILPAALLGFAAYALADGTLYGREINGYRVENDRYGLTEIPAVLTGLCVSVEVATVAWLIGRSIDRSNAERTARKKPKTGR